MQELNEQVAYLRGLVEGHEFAEGKSRVLWEKTLEIFTLAAEGLEQLQKEQKHLAEYIEAIDEDLGFLEDHFYAPEESDQEEGEIQLRSSGEKEDPPL